MNNRVSDTRDIQIVKVQRPVAEMGDPDKGPAPVLIYDERRKHTVNVRYADLPKWLVLVLEKQPKVYARAAWSGTGWTFVGQKQVGPQAW